MDWWHDWDDDDEGEHWWGRWDSGYKEAPNGYDNPFVERMDAMSEGVLSASEHVRGFAETAGRIANQTEEQWRM